MKTVICTIIVLLQWHEIRAECQDNTELLEENLSSLKVEMKLLNHNFHTIKAQSDVLINKFVGMLVRFEMQDQAQQDVKNELNQIKLDIHNGLDQRGEVLEKLDSLYRGCDVVPTTTDPPIPESTNTVSSDCDKGVIVSGQCLIVSEDKLSWQNAKESCSAQNLTLVSLTNATEFHEFATMTYGTTARERIWLGGSDITSEGSWVWINGEPLGDQFPWPHPEPNDGKGAEDCLEWGWEGNFNDGPCTYKRRYVCEQGVHSSS